MATERDPRRSANVLGSKNQGINDVGKELKAAREEITALQARVQRRDRTIETLNTELKGLKEQVCPSSMPSSLIPLALN